MSNTNDSTGKDPKQAVNSLSNPYSSDNGNKHFSTMFMFSFWFVRDMKRRTLVESHQLF